MTEAVSTLDQQRKAEIISALFSPEEGQEEALAASAAASASASAAVSAASAASAPRESSVSDDPNKKSCCARVWEVFKTIIIYIIRIVSFGLLDFKKPIPIPPSSDTLGSNGSGSHTSISSACASPTDEVNPVLDWKKLPKPHLTDEQREEMRKMEKKIFSDEHLQVIKYDSNISGIYDPETNVLKISFNDKRQAERFLEVLTLMQHYIKQHKYDCIVLPDYERDDTEVTFKLMRPPVSFMETLFLVESMKDPLQRAVDQLHALLQNFYVPCCCTDLEYLQGIVPVANKEDPENSRVIFCGMQLLLKLEPQKDDFGINHNDGLCGSLFSSVIQAKGFERQTAVKEFSDLTEGYLNFLEERRPELNKDPCSLPELNRKIFKSCVFAIRQEEWKITYKKSKKPQEQQQLLENLLAELCKKVVSFLEISLNENAKLRNSSGLTGDALCAIKRTLIFRDHEINGLRQQLKEIVQKHTTKIQECGGGGVYSVDWTLLKIICTAFAKHGIVYKYEHSTDKYSEGREGKMVILC